MSNIDYVAVGDLGDWIALPQSKKDFYDNNHYLTLENAKDAASTTPLDDYECQLISDTEINITFSMPTSFNGKKFRITSSSGNTFKIVSNVSSYDILFLNITELYYVEFENIEVVFNALKETAYRSFFEVISPMLSLKIFNNVFNGDNNSGTSVRWNDATDGGGVFEFYNNECKKLGRGVYVFQGNPTSKINRNTIVDSIEYGIRDLGSGSREARNNALIGGADRCIDPINHGDSNVTSDSTGQIGDIAKSDAFVDPDNGDFTPKLIMRQGVAPTIDGHTHYKNGVPIRSPYYIGALGVASGGGSRSRKRKRILIIAED